MTVVCPRHLHYLVKCRSRSLTVYTSDWVLWVAHAWAQKIIVRQVTTKSLQICYLFKINLLYQDLGRRRTETTHHQGVGRSESHGY